MNYLVIVCMEYIWKYVNDWYEERSEDEELNSSSFIVISVWIVSFPE